ncbi:MFS siderochrome iron transporter 1 [Fusarium oxysporum f. sp. albedinis]|nr:MFS siderochrome iron transporter 1 [Fusarium oxysporum f. sp. albedinis]
MYTPFSSPFQPFLGLCCRLIQAYPPLPPTITLSLGNHPSCRSLRSSIPLDIPDPRSLNRTDEPTKTTQAASSELTDHGAPH